MHQLSTDQRVQIIAALVEGNSVNSTCRMLGRNKRAVLKLLADVGKVCRTYHDEHVCHLLTSKVQVDEIWNFCYCKQQNVPVERRGQFGFGDVWTFVGIDADTKLIISYLVARRDKASTHEFMHDLAWRLARKVQLTTDGHSTYPNAVDAAFNGDVDFAQLIKIYENERASSAARYSPPTIVRTETEVVCGTPEPREISTSFVERSNLTMRMNMRRYTRLTNGFSKKAENMQHAVALNFMHYNYCRIHQTLRITPAMAAGLTDHVWELEELVALLP